VGSLPAFVIADRFTADGAKFIQADRLLDASPTGQRWLMRADVAEEVRETLLWGEREGEYRLGSWVLMPNHVHLILLPHGELSRVVAALKARTAKRANLLLSRTGEAFWAKDYYDHWIRSRTEEQKIARYIEQNPVKAGLRETAELWPWSSACQIQPETRLAPRVPATHGG
jgi:REP element-mobilizing transposase RayT